MIDNCIPQSPADSIHPFNDKPKGCAASLPFAFLVGDIHNAYAHWLCYAMYRFADIHNIKGIAVIVADVVVWRRECTKVNALGRHIIHYADAVTMYDFIHISIIPHHYTDCTIDIGGAVWYNWLVNQS